MNFTEFVSPNETPDNTDPSRDASEPAGSMDPLNPPAEPDEDSDGARQDETLPALADSTPASGVARAGDAVYSASAALDRATINAGRALTRSAGSVLSATRQALSRSGKPAVGGPTDESPQEERSDATDAPAGPISETPPPSPAAETSAADAERKSPATTDAGASPSSPEPTPDAPEESASTGAAGSASPARRRAAEVAPTGDESEDPSEGRGSRPAGPVRRKAGGRRNGGASGTPRSRPLTPEDDVVEAGGAGLPRSRSGSARARPPRGRRVPLGLPASSGRSGEIVPVQESSPLEAAKRRPWLIVVPIAVLALAAFLFALARTPVYTAETRLGVGEAQVTTEEVPGVTAARVTLAASYSRLINAQDVLEPLAAATGRSTDELGGRLSGIPAPDSPLFLVRATGGSEASAVELANLAADALAGYVEGLNTDAGAAPALLEQFETAQRRVERLAIEVAEAERAFDERATDANRRALSVSRAAFRTAQLQAGDLRRRYQRANEIDAEASGVVVVNPAISATSDAASFRNRLVFTAAVLGALIGLALAWLVMRGRLRLPPMPALPRMLRPPFRSTRGDDE